MIDFKDQILNQIKKLELDLYSLEYEDIPNKEISDKCLWKDSEGNIWYGSAYQSQNPIYWRQIDFK